MCVCVRLSICLSVSLCVRLSECVYLRGRKGCGPSYYYNVEVRETLVGYYGIS